MSINNPQEVLSINKIFSNSKRNTEYFAKTP